MRGIDINSWSTTRRVDVASWLTKNFGKQGVEKRWYIDRGVGYTNIIMDEDVFITYLLKWPQ